MLSRLCLNGLQLAFNNTSDVLPESHFQTDEALRITQEVDGNVSRRGVRVALPEGLIFGMQVDFATIVQKSYHSGLFIGAGSDLLQ